MSKENFVDHVRIFCRSGSGGAGSVHFYRAKYIPRGGPDGGNGGKGGDVIIRGNNQLWTLLHLRYTRHVYAENGQGGMGNKKTGADGNNVIVEVPLGTVLKNSETGAFMLEILEHGEEKVLLAGGRGGMGNEFFKTATMQTPKFAQPGEEGIETSVVFELKILADVGLVGFPNAGKSTLLSVISAAKPKIADYPFTTLTPNLGMVQYRDFKSFVMADIPGIIEGAHEGKGLGLRFLRHIERNSVLLFMIPTDSQDIIKEFRILQNELKMYNPELADKDFLLAVTKCDLLPEEELVKLRKKLTKHQPLFISSHTGAGITELKDKLWSVLNRFSI
jgi:GTPase